MRRSIQFESLDEVLSEAKRLQRDGYDRLGNWSLGQMCNHLAQEIDMFLVKPLQIVPGPVKKLMVGSFLQSAIVAKAVNVLRLRLPTIKPQNRPVDDADGVQRLRDAIARQQKSGADELIPFHLWHAAHHFSFLIPKPAPSGDPSAESEQLAAPSSSS